MSNSLTSALLAALNSMEEQPSGDDARAVADLIDAVGPASQALASLTRAQVQAVPAGDNPEERLVATIRLGMAKARSVV
jgi:hypothetical protein